MTRPPTAWRHHDRRREPDSAADDVRRFPDARERGGRRGRVTRTTRGISREGRRDRRGGGHREEGGGRPPTAPRRGGRGGPPAGGETHEQGGGGGGGGKEG